jgi:hypothetical protein
MQSGLDRLPNQVLKRIPASKRAALIVDAGSASDDSSAGQQCFQAVRGIFYALHPRTDPIVFRDCRLAEHDAIHIPKNKTPKREKQGTAAGNSEKDLALDIM